MAMSCRDITMDATVNVASADTRTVGGALLLEEGGVVPPVGVDDDCSGKNILLGMLLVERLLKLPLRLGGFVIGSASVGGKLVTNGSVSVGRMAAREGAVRHGQPY